MIGGARQSVSLAEQRQSSLGCDMAFTALQQHLTKLIDRDEENKTERYNIFIMITPKCMLIIGAMGSCYRYVTCEMTAPLARVRRTTFCVSVVCRHTIIIKPTMVKLIPLYSD